MHQTKTMQNFVLYFIEDVDFDSSDFVRKILIQKVRKSESSAKKRTTLKADAR